MNESATKLTEELVAGLRAGEEESIAAIFHRYYENLLNKTKRNISPRLRARVDGEGIVQTAFRTFCRRAGQGKYELASGENIMALLTCIAHRKLLKQIEKLQTKKRSGEMAIGDLLASLENSEDSAEDIAAFNETIESARVKLPKEGQDALELVLQGYTSQEIQDELGINDYRVRFVRATLLEAIEASLRVD